MPILLSEWALNLRRMIARERGIAAYRAWLPLERIRPNHIPREQWEETFAWPANDRPPYRPLVQRMMIASAIYALVILIVIVALGVYAPSVLSWLGEMVRRI